MFYKNKTIVISGGDDGDEVQTQSDLAPPCSKSLVVGGSGVHGVGRRSRGQCRIKNDKVAKIVYLLVSATSDFDFDCMFPEDRRLRRLKS